MEMDNQEGLLEYACGRFEAGFYDETLEAFVLAYAKGYERDDFKLYLDWYIQLVDATVVAVDEIRDFAGRTIVLYAKEHLEQKKRKTMRG